MNLIANTGLQFLNFPLEINFNDNFKMYFHEWFDAKDEQLKLEIAVNCVVYVPGVKNVKLPFERVLSVIPSKL